MSIVFCAAAIIISSIVGARSKRLGSLSSDEADIGE